MTSQPTWVKQGGEKGPASDSTLPAFTDSLVVASKAVESEASAVKGGRRSKTDEDDAKPMEGAHDGNALMALVQVAPPQVLPTPPVSDGTAVAICDGCAVGDKVATPAGSTGPASMQTGAGTHAAQGVSPAGVLEKFDEGESVRPWVGGDSSNAAPAGSAELKAVAIVAPLFAAMPMPVVPVSETVGPAPREIGVGTISSGEDDVAGTFSGAAAVAGPNVSAVVPNAAGAAVDLRALLVKAGAGPVGGGKAAVEPSLGKAVANVSARAKAGSKTGFKDGFEAKQGDKPAPVAAEAADVSGDRPQRDGSSQGQGLADVIAAVGHEVTSVAHTQIAPNGVDAQSVTAPDAGVGHTSRTNEVGAAAAVEIAQPLPAINTAKLIQTVGQTEMRVGMRSAEFGTISIRTSSTAELMSAQISVDHGELGRMLAMHVPEMQAKLGGGQAVHVQVEMSGQNAGSQGGQANGSAADAESSRRHQDGQGPRGSDGGAGAQRYQRESLPVGLMNESGNTRLDVRV